MVRPLAGAAGGRRVTARISIIAAVALVAVAVYFILGLPNNRNGVDLAKPHVEARRAITRGDAIEVDELKRRFESAFAGTQRWKTLSEQQREALTSQVASQFAAWMAPSPDGYIDLMSSWGGTIGTRMTREQMSKFWTSDAMESFPIAAFNPSQAALSDIRVVPTSEGPAFATLNHEAPTARNSLHTTEWTAFDFGVKYQLVESTCAVVTIPWRSMNGAVTTYEIVYFWSDVKQRWLPSVLLGVTSAERTAASPVVF